MITCESCRNLRGKLRILRGRIDYRSFSCGCTKELLWNESKKEPQKFELGGRASLKNYIYEKWKVSAVRCAEYDSMDN